MNHSTAQEILLMMRSMTPRAERLLRLYTESVLGVTWRLVFLLVLDIAAEQARK